jgi:hypothetical protein
MAALSIATSVPVPNGDADIRLCQCRSVIHTVSSHRDLPACRLQSLDCLSLLVGKNLRLDVVDAQLAGD